MSANSKLKFLSAYDKNDGDIFFGRDEEVEMLYRTVHKSNVTLVYGQSGTGKTSLIQCGLANRIPDTDWFDIPVRRKANINDSLLEALEGLEQEPEEFSDALIHSILGEQTSESKEESAEPKDRQDTNAITDLLDQIYTFYLKPIYLIFDQFEELYILGDRENEQPVFHQTVSDILARCPYCRIIFVIREEFIAQLYELEKTVPSLFDYRVRVEPMSPAKATRVVEQTAASIDDIQLESDDVATAIITEISRGNRQIDLTHLQVFLDALYSRGQRDKKGTVIFTADSVAKLGSIGDVLAAFLDLQVTEIQDDLANRFPGISVTAVRSTVESFASIEGTKLPIPVEEIKIPGLDEEQTDACLNALAQRRILYRTDEICELTHDALAKRINETRSTADLEYLEVIQLVKDRFRSFQTSPTYLSSAELEFIGNYRKRIISDGKLNSEQLKFWNDSQKNAESNARKRRGLVLAGFLLVVLVAAALVMYWRIGSSAYKNSLSNGNLAVQSGNLDMARQNYNQATSWILSDPAISDTIRLIDTMIGFEVTYQSYQQQIKRTLIQFENTTIDTMRWRQLRIVRDAVRELAKDTAFYTPPTLQSYLGLHSEVTNAVKWYTRDLVYRAENLCRQNGLQDQGRLRLEIALDLDEFPTEELKTKTENLIISCVNQ